MPRGSFPAIIPWYGVLWNPRDHLQLYHEVRRRYQKGLVRQHRSLWRNHNVPRNRRQNAEGDHLPGPNYHEGQNHCSTREKILRLDRRIHPRLPLHLPTDVDLQTGVRRVWSFHRAQKMLLKCYFFTFYIAFLYRFRPLYLTLVIVQLELKLIVWKLINLNAP